MVDGRYLKFLLNFKNAIFLQPLTLLQQNLSGSYIGPLLTQSPLKNLNFSNASGWLLF